MTLLLSKVMFWGPGARTLSYLWGDKIQSVTITRSFSFPKLFWVKEVYSLWQGASCPPTVVLPSIMRCDCRKAAFQPSTMFSSCPCFWFDHATSCHQWNVDRIKFVSSDGSWKTASILILFTWGLREWQIPMEENCLHSDQKYPNWSVTGVRTKLLSCWV